MNFQLLESLPIAALSLCIFVLMLVFGEAGFQLGSHARTRLDKEAPESLGPMVGGLLAMLAFVLAITFSMASAQHAARKNNVLEEANAIGTAYLRADLIDSQYGSEVKSLLRKYVDIRLQATSGGDINAAITRSVEIHKKLWAQVSEAANDNPNTNTLLAIQSINTVIDMHERRVTAALRDQIPVSIWIALALIVALTMMTMGTQVGFTGKRRLVAVVPMVLAFAVLVTLVADLNRPQGGLITVGQQSMTGLQDSMTP